MNLALSGGKEINGSFCLRSFSLKRKHILLIFVKTSLWRVVLLKLIDHTADPDKKMFLLLSGSKFHTVWMFTYCILFSQKRYVKSEVKPGSEFERAPERETFKIIHIQCFVSDCHGLIPAST